MEPEHFFPQLAPAICFCGWLWLGYSVGLLPIRLAAQRLFNLLIGTLLILAAVGWVYLAIASLTAGSNPFRLPLTMLFLLILAIAASYLPLSPWRSTLKANTPNLVIMARLELFGLLLLLGVGGMVILAPLGTDILGGLPSLFETYPVLFLFIGTLAVAVITAVEPKIGHYLSALGLMLLAMITTYVVLVLALIATI